MQIWPQLQRRLHPVDQPPPASWSQCYETKFAMARLLQPKSILEIGVRAGYSAFTFLSACPTSQYLGIDPNGIEHGGFVGAIHHARQLLAPFHAQVIELSSEQLAMKRPEAEVSCRDLVHIDGDHSEAGCTFDLELALQIGFRHALVDDYRGIPEVRSACDRFFDAHRAGLSRVVIDDGHNGAVLFERCANA